MFHFVLFVLPHHLVWEGPARIGQSRSRWYLPPPASSAGFVGVGVQGDARAVVTQGVGPGFHIYAVLQRRGGERLVSGARCERGNTSFSTVSYNLRHRYTGETVERIFRWVLWEANRAGALTPGAVFIDGTHIKASANVNKKIKQEVPAEAARYRAARKSVPDAPYGSCAPAPKTALKPSCAMFGKTPKNWPTTPDTFRNTKSENFFPFPLDSGAPPGYNAKSVQRQRVARAVNPAENAAQL